MISKSDFNQIDRYLWELPRSYREGMNVPVHIYASDILFDEFLLDRTVSQIINVATLPGIEKAAIVMPDGHEGYGFPIGGVAAFRLSDGVISPGGIGYDINCGVRLMTLPMTCTEIRSKIPELTHELTRMIPKGMGRGGRIKLTNEEMDEVLHTGSEWAVKNGYGLQEDLAYTESNGRLQDADPDMVSDRAKQRGYDQLGTLGAGNHFVEIDRVEEIYDDHAAEAFGIFEDQLVIFVHTGSRGLGHQVATDYLKLFVSKLAKFGFKLPDRELACAPYHSKEGQDYFHAMAASANYAWCNRQVITWEVRKAIENTLKISSDRVRLLYDVAHNIAKLETHDIDGVKKKLIVHRKGATRAFGPGSSEIPKAYLQTGQPVLIPGSMGTCSYLLAGTESGMKMAFGSTCHGAGRRLSRTAAKKEVNAPKLKQELELQGISVESGSFAGLAEEAPVAYKDVDMVVETVHESGLASKVAKVKPVGVIKG